MLPVAPGAALPWSNGVYSVKRHGVTITNCDSEPVHTPGCIQAHGALLVVRPSDLEILQISENVHALLGQHPADLLGRPIGAALGDEPQARVRRFLDQKRADHGPLYLLTLPAREGAPALDVTVHTADDVAVIELEATGRTDGVEPDYVGLLQKTVSRLHSATSVGELGRILSAEVRAITGFGRVMIYKFHADGHGEVFAESRDEALAPWLGLHYPAEDIPRPAREIFKRVWCRPVSDVAGALAELVPLAHPVTQAPLTMTHCALRGPSIMYTEYLRNMGVTAGLTMPIRKGSELWGLIACHDYAGPKHVTYPVRAACEFVAQIASLQLDGASEREHVLYRLRVESVHNDLLARAAHDGGLATLFDGRPGMLEGLQAGGAALYEDAKWWKVGDAPSDHELDALALYLEGRPELGRTARGVYATDSLPQHYPPAAAFADRASGLLAIALSQGRRNLMMWFRPETIRVVDWGGDPHDKPMTSGPHGPRLTPRASFELFRESVRNRSLPWLDVEVDAAARLRVLVMDVIVGRAEHLADLNADLTRSNEELDAFAHAAGHDLKEPLRGIQQFARQLLESATRTDQEERTKLEVLIRLTMRMDSLLDSLLHFARVGRTTLELEPTNLDEVAREALEMVGSRTTDPSSEVTIPRELPRLRCDRVRVREIFVNLLSNALKYTDKPTKLIEVGYIARGENMPRPGAPTGAAEQTIFFVKDNGIGISDKDIGPIFTMFRRLHAQDEFGGGTGAGLSIVQKLVERHRGQIWVVSTLGWGSTFFFTLPGDGGPCD
ncbi:MAG: multi-sensor signal transduction histidine kinase [Labilithrix sp.]|nr:multi-sensor signal transduction histidine kinase [Labilithrix sp.]